MLHNEMTHLCRSERRGAADAMASDASHMLEAALEQMDDIIAGKRQISVHFRLKCS